MLLQHQLPTLSTVLDDQTVSYVCTRNCPFQNSTPLGSHLVSQAVLTIIYCHCTYLSTHPHHYMMVFLSLSLHGFLPTGFVWSQGRQSRYIRMNSTGTRRRRPGIPRRTKMAPQGRPIKRRHARSSRLNNDSQKTEKNSQFERCYSRG